LETQCAGRRAGAHRTDHRGARGAGPGGVQPRSGLADFPQGRRPAEAAGRAHHRDQPAHARIEKLRLTPKDVNNGEAPTAPCRDFALLNIDEAHFNRLGLRWETIVKVNRDWLLLHDYPLPAGYAVAHTKIALEIPPNYPGAQIYGFYAYPPLALSSGRTIESTQLRGVLLGVEFHGWSRNRGAGAPWNPTTDNVVTQFVLVDAALAKEGGE